jgi:putative membrane protein
VHRNQKEIALEVISASLPILADANGADHMNGWSWGWMMGGWLAMVLVVALIVWAFQGTGLRRGMSHRPDAREILAERFARGEISADEYKKRRSVLDRVLIV